VEGTVHFSKELRLILYGVNLVSERLYRALEDAGYHVEAFFDRRYRELNGQYPVPVRALSDDPYGGMEKDGFCVIILLQNAAQHEPIARDFLKRGYRRILFAPVLSELPDETAAAFRKTYNLLLEGEYQELRNIPLLHDGLFGLEDSVRHSIIEKEGSHLVVWAPVELLHSGLVLLEHPELTNIPLSAYTHYLELFQYLQGETGNCRAYLECCVARGYQSPNSYSDQDVLTQRKQLLETYMTELNKGMGFFISSAAAAKWNDGLNAFNLTDGHHRSVFLLARGFRYIPVRISGEDFRKWNRVCRSERLRACLNGGGKRPHILHPGYKKAGEVSDRTDLLQLQSIQRWMAAEHGGWLEGKTALDLSGAHGYYARGALRMRARGAAVYAPEGKELIEEIGALEGFPCVEILDRWDETGKTAYHTLFVLGALADMPAEEKARWIERCAQACREECFAAVQDAGELELWKDRFPEARSLRKLFDRGRTVELYALRK